MAETQAVQAGQEATTWGLSWGCDARAFARALGRAGFTAVPFGPGGPPSIDVQDTQSGKSWLVQWDFNAGVWNWYLRSGDVAPDFALRSQLITDALAAARDSRSCRKTEELFARAVAGGGPAAGELVRDMSRGRFAAGQVPELARLLRGAGVRVTAREVWAVLWRGRRKAARYWEVWGSYGDH